MASYPSDVWECEARYVSLYDLASRASGSFSWALSPRCGVRGCPRSFQQANSWYRHIRNSHSSEYQSREPFPNLDDANGGLHLELMVVNPPESPVHSIQDPNESTFDDNQPGSDSQQTVPENPHFILSDVAAGLLMKLKDKHHLSQTALDDVVETTSSVWEHVLQEVHIAIQEVANKRNMNPQSSFLEDVMDCIYQDWQIPYRSWVLHIGNKLMLLSTMWFVDKKLRLETKIVVATFYMLSFFFKGTHLVMK